MPKHKIKRKVPSIDMTAMVDVAFLLLTFFILTTKFRPNEAVAVDTPSSISKIKVPMTDIFLITVADDGRVFVGVGDRNTRLDIFERMVQSFGITYTPAGQQFFLSTENFGVPISEFPTWLSQPDPQKMKDFPQKGIPMDKRRGKVNELKEWIMAVRRANIDTRFAIKGDVDVKYDVMGDVIWTLQDANINKFNLVTGLEEDPNAKAAAAAAAAKGAEGAN